jgi:hypothetical protein
MEELVATLLLFFLVVAAPTTTAFRMWNIIIAKEHAKVEGLGALHA